MHPGASLLSLLMHCQGECSRLGKHLPMPEVAPVTMTVLPLMSKSGSMAEVKVLHCGRQPCVGRDRLYKVILAELVVRLVANVTMTLCSLTHFFFRP
jgi:hypothetical protein